MLTCPIKSAITDWHFDILTRFQVHWIKLNKTSPKWTTHKSKKKKEKQFDEISVEFLHLILKEKPFCTNTILKFNFYTLKMHFLMNFILVINLWFVKADIFFYSYCHHLLAVWILQLNFVTSSTHGVMKCYSAFKILKSLIVELLLLLPRVILLFEFI